MADMRARRRSAKTDLAEHLAEMDDDIRFDQDSDDDPLEDLQASLKEIAWLRKEVADLGAQLAIIRGEQDEPGTNTARYSWPSTAVAVVTTLALAKLLAHANPKRFW